MRTTLSNFEGPSSPHGTLLSIRPPKAGHDELPTPGSSRLFPLHGLCLVELLSYKLFQKPSISLAYPKDAGPQAGFMASRRVGRR